MSLANYLLRKKNIQHEARRNNKKESVRRASRQHCKYKHVITCIVHMYSSLFIAIVAHAHVYVKYLKATLAELINFNETV